jgi:hypothetical protein
MSRACASVPRYRIGMTITKRLAALVASALALAANHDAGAWRPRPKPARAADKSTVSAGPQTTPDQAQPAVQPPESLLTPGPLAVFASTGVLAAAAAVSAWMLLKSEFSPLPGQTHISSLAPQTFAPALSQIAACPSRPVTAVAGEKDGKIPLQTGVTGLVAADIVSFMVVGKEAAAIGRSRDAEVAFLMACQVADELKGVDSIESAQARYELGSHYAQLALEGNPATAPNRDTLRSYAERLHSDSLHLYHFNQFTYGQAREQPALTSQKQEQEQEKIPVPVQQSLSEQESLQPAPLPGPLPMLVNPAQDRGVRRAGPVRPLAKSLAKPPAPTVASAQSGKIYIRKTALPAQPRPNAVMPLRPSFDCRKARSVSEKMICSDAELARLDCELGPLYARAKRAASDRVAFQRQQEREWRMREALCRDRECMLRWYAQRRQQLMAVVDQRERPKPLARRSGKLPAEVASLYRGN